MGPPPNGIDPPPDNAKRSTWKSSLIALVLTALLIGSLTVPLFFASSSPAPGNWTYSQLLQNAKAHQVTRLTIDGTSGTAVNRVGKTFDVTLPADTSGLAAQLAGEGVNVQYRSTWLDGIGSWLPTLLIVGVMVVLFWWFFRGSRAGAGQAMSFGRSRARNVQEERSQVTFDDVAGVDEAQQELSEVVEFLKTPDKFAALGARIPKGVLMIGPPGTGKTLLARAVAGEAGVPFFTISGSEFVEMFVGVGASRVRDLFAKAKAAAPCIVFVDEVDAVGRRRGMGISGNNDEREQTLNQLLVEMDGFETNTYVIVMAATNRPDVLDPALLRAGRFDRHVTLDVPDRRGRRAILAVHVKNKPLAPDVDLDVVASQTPGFCGADLYNLANEAAILAARAGRHQLTTSDFEEAIALVIAGPERKSMLLSPEEKRVIAYHEAGHTLVMKSLPGCDHVRRVSIISRGSALGWTLGLPDADRRLVAEDVIRDQLAGLLGGRASEEVSFGRVTSGAENDLERATELARRMVVRWGMSDRLGAVTLPGAVALGEGVPEGGPQPYSEETAAAIDAEIRRLVEEAHATARRVLLERKSTLEELAQRLLDEETIEEDEIERIVHPGPSPAVAALVSVG